MKCAMPAGEMSLFLQPFVVVGPRAVLTVFLEIDHHLLDFVLRPRLVRCADIESDQHHV